jgi:3-(methylthio)propionyl---CoA ligase
LAEHGLVTPPRDGVSQAEKALCLWSPTAGALSQGKVARWWMPDDVVFVESIPMTATGKISKKRLREQFKDFVLQQTKL